MSSRRLSKEQSMRLDSTRIENFLLKDLCTRLVVSTLHVATTSFVSLMPLSPFDSLMVQSDELTEFDKSIPTEMFRFQSYDQLLALADTNRQLPDILGVKCYQEHHQ